VFELNADFQISVEPNDQQASLEELVCTIRCDSVNKLTPQALSDKLVRHRIVSNLGIPQMPVHYLVQGNSVEKAEVENFVLTHLCGPQSHPVAIKPTHLRNGVGVIFVGRVAPEDGPQPTVNYLVHHMNKYLAQRPESCEHCEDDLLKPGFMAQEKYEAFLGFDRPLELRVFVLWGRCRLASWWSHGANSGDQPIVTLARNLVHNSRSGSTDEWSVLHSRAGSDPMYYKALEVLQCEVQTIAATAESLATEVGSPFLRADFFVGSERWGIRLNDVACGDALNNSLLELSDESSNSHALAIAHAIRDGHSLCQRRFPPEHFLSRLGVRGGCYKDMVVMDLKYSDSIASDVPSKKAQSSSETSAFAQDRGLVDDVVPGAVEELRPKAEHKSCQELPAPRSSRHHDYKLGDEVEVWSKSQQMWFRGRVQKIASSTVSVSFTLPDGMLYSKDLPPGHRDLRRITVVDLDEVAVNNTWKVGDEIEVYSNSRKVWGQGRIERVAARDGDQVVLARFRMPDGSICEKEMWASSTELRRATPEEDIGSAQVVTARRPNPATSPKIRAPDPVSVESECDFADISPIVGTQNLNLEAQKENAQPPNSAPNKAPVRRSSSYAPASFGGLQQLSAPAGQTSTAKRKESYVPSTSTSNHVAQKPIFLMQDCRSSVQASPDASPDHRSFSYVPPAAEPLSRQPVVQPSLSVASPVNQKYVPSCATSPTHQVVSGYLRIPSSLGMQGSLQARAKSMPPQRSLVASPLGGVAQAYPATSSAPPGMLAKARSARSLIAGGKLQVEDIATAPGLPDPMNPLLRPQILARLGIAPDAAIKKMAACGGQNDGVWLLEASGINCVLKLVRNQNIGIELPTETEKFSRLAAACPQLLYDDALTFPMRIFRLRSHVQNPTFDLLVMPMASGERLSDVISILWALKKRAEVMNIMERAGKFLKDFHVRYNNAQHCDFQPSNLFYEKSQQKFTLVDLADFGQQALITESDVDHFANGLRIMGKSLGPEFLETLRHFQAGYNSGGC